MKEVLQVKKDENTVLQNLLDTLVFSSFYTPCTHRFHAETACLWHIGFYATLLAPVVGVAGTHSVSPLILSGAWARCIFLESFGFLPRLCCLLRGNSNRALKHRDTRWCWLWAWLWESEHSFANRKLQVTWLSEAAWLVGFLFPYATATYQ